MKFIAPGESLPGGTAVWPNTDDVLTHGDAVHALPGIALQFPKWTDGRAYSQAVLLRLRMRYRGELLATGEVLADMLPLLRRCGFSGVQLRADQKLESAQRALGWFDGSIAGSSLQASVTAHGPLDSQAHHQAQYKAQTKAHYQAAPGDAPVDGPSAGA